MIKRITDCEDKWICLALACSLILIAIFGRLIPHPSNFAPVAAIAIFGGAMLPKKLALVLPVSAMIISDLIIGLHPLIIFTWGAFALIALLSSRYLNKISVSRLIAAGIGSSLIFYLITNFGVWLQGQMYAMNFAGLIKCYYMALPFLRNTMIGDLFYVGVVFGAYLLSCKLVAELRIENNSNGQGTDSN